MTLSERITELETALVDARARVSQYERGREVVPQQLRGRVQRLEADLGWLRELRARRIAMGRAADDERNAPRDMCCCVPEDGSMAGWRWIKQRRDMQTALGGCPLHPGPAPDDNSRVTITIHRPGEDITAEVNASGAIAAVDELGQPAQLTDAEACQVRERARSKRADETGR